MWPNRESANAGPVLSRQDARDFMLERRSLGEDYWLWLPFDGSSALMLEDFENDSAG